MMAVVVAMLLSGRRVLLGIELRFPMILAAALAVLARPVVVRPGPATRRRRRASAPSPLAPTMAFIVWLALSTLWAPPQARVASALVDLAALGGMLTVASGAWKRFHPDLMTRFWHIWLVIGGVYLLTGLAAGPGVQGRYSALGGGPNVFVRVMGVALLASVVLGLERARYLGLAPLFAIGALLSGSRGGLLAIAVGGVALLVFSGIRWAKVLCLTLAAIAVGLVAERSFPVVAEVYQTRFVQATWESRYVSGRSEAGRIALDIFGRSPLVGSGLDGFYALKGRSVGLEYAHNLFLAAIAEGGIIAGAVLVLSVSSLLRGCVTLARSDANAAGLTACALMILVASMFSGDYFDARLLWFFGLGLTIHRGPEPDIDLLDLEQRDAAPVTLGPPLQRYRRTGNTR